MNAFYPNRDGIGTPVEFSGVNGPFFLANAGGKPELENCIYYGDSGNEFFFYVSIEIDKINNCIGVIDVFAASHDRFEFLMEHMNDADKNYIQMNIEAAFSQRSVWRLASPADGGLKPKKVVFSWKI